MARNAAQKSIIRTALILTVLTALEFVIAFTWMGIGESMGFAASTVKTAQVWIFILMTLAKAYYIVAEFMHLGHELRRMIASILFPFIFAVWLIIVALIEGGYYGKLTKDSYGFNDIQTQMPANDQVVEIERLTIYG